MNPVKCSVDTSVHRKKTHTDRYLNFKSHHPLAHKRSVVSTLFKRAKELSSDAGCRSKEEAYIGRTLGWNGYPRRFVRRTAMGCHRKKSGEEEREEDKPTATATIPYVGGVSEPIKRMLEKVNVRVRLRPCGTLRQFLMKPKDRVPIEERTGVVYRVTCKDCPKTYVGQSGRTLQCRMKEHRRATERGNMDSSAIAEHSWKFNHRVNWEEVEVLDVDTEWYRRCMLESWHIQREKETMNRDQGTLPLIYNTL